MLNNTIALYNLDKLREMCGDDEAFIVKMVTMFLEQGPTMTTGIREAYAAGNLARVKEVAHKLKPSLDFMGIYDMMPVIKEIEVLAVANEAGDHLEGLINELHEVTALACNQLSAEVA